MSDTLLVLGRQGLPACPAKPQTLGAADPFGSGRKIAFQDDAGFSSGHVDLAGDIAVSTLSYAEVIVLVAGSIALADDRFSTGEALVLPKGFSGKVSLATGTRWFFCAITAGDKGAESKAIRLNPALPRAVSPGPAAEVVVGTPPECHSLNLFTDPSALRAGVWDVTTPCERTFVPHRVHELMHLIEGEVTLTHRSGTTEVIGAGDTVFLPRSAPYAWKSTAKIVKYYCVM
jgi:uncharacterized cupin superfamily protein